MPTDPASQSPPTKSSYRALLLLVEIMTALETDALHENIVRGTLKFVEPGSKGGDGLFRVHADRLPGNENGLPGEAPTHIPDDAAENVADNIRNGKRILLPVHFLEPFTPSASRFAARRAEA